MATEGVKRRANRKGQWERPMEKKEFKVLE
jgi:hypothetical protein